jgi:outer membrane lipoprotein-sorting protein
MLDRRRLTFALLAAAAAGPAAAQAQLSAPDRALLARAVAYLEGLAQAKGRFVQTDGRGRTTTGVLYLKRPGKARFAYDPPSGLVVVSNGATVSVADPRLKSFESYPLGMTPLSLFLARNIRLDRGVKVTGLARTAEGFTVSVRDATRKTAGQLTLAFADAPLRLSGWTVTDAQGRTTRVRLVELAPSGALDGSLFQLKDPRPKNVGRARM